MPPEHQLPTRPTPARDSRNRRPIRRPLPVGTGGAAADLVVELGRRSRRLGPGGGGTTARLTGGAATRRHRPVQGTDHPRTDHEPDTGAGTPSRGAGAGESSRADRVADAATSPADRAASRP